MPRANRVFLPGHIWHITERCHQRDFLLKARHDRRSWLRWLLEARRRHGLCVLNYIVTRNHIHLLVQDRGNGEIAAAMQLVAGRTGQSYNNRTGRVGAFWQDRYHATAVESDAHLLRCMAYIDLNMVRAGVVTHPADWRDSGYCEIRALPQRYRIIDIAALCRLVGCDTPVRLRDRVIGLTGEMLQERVLRRDAVWTESLAVGNESYLRQVKQELGHRASRRNIEASSGVLALREASAPYRVHVRNFAARP
jgi:putative transposase